jgi:hypothetical protein
MADKLPPISETIARSTGKCCDFGDLRQRAFNKADTGRYADWREVGEAVEAENCPGAVDRLRGDPILTRVLTTRCEQAKDRNAQGT